jgi:N-methylhydantoinase B
MKMPLVGKSMVHPLTLAVVRYKLLSIAEEVVDTMVRTCFSPLLNQSRDFSAVVLDGTSRIVAQAERIPVHMGAMPFAVEAMHEAFAATLAEGDILMANDPYWGGSHLPDITLAVPIFSGGRLRFWVANRAHQGDIGGLSPGGYSPGARVIWHEGLRIPPMKLAEGGVIREDFLRLVCENTRKPDDTRGDIMAQIASISIGKKRIDVLIEKYGIGEIERCAEAILDAGEAAMRAQFRRWKPGTYTGVSYLDSDGCGGRRVPITAHVTLTENDLEVDFRDCPDQVASFMNSPFANTAACANAAIMYMSDDRHAQNGGSARTFRVATRKGSIVDCVPPAPVAGCTTLIGSVIIEAVLRALENAAPQNAIAGFARRFRFVIDGVDRDGATYIWHLFSNRGGAGANPAHDGWNNLGVIHNPGGSPAPSIERTESEFPLLVERYELRPDSAGAGRQRGGVGGVFVLRYEGEAEATLTAAGEGVAVAPYGVAGGQSGLNNEYRIRRGSETIVLNPQDAQVIVKPGDVIVSRSGGGGGFGDPKERSRALVARDVEYGYITAETARDIYGFDE